MAYSIIILIISWLLFTYFFDKYNKKQAKKILENYNIHDDKGRKGSVEFEGSSRTEQTAPITNPIPPRPTRPEKSRVLQTTETNVSAEDSKGNRKLRKFIERFRRTQRKK